MKISKLATVLLFVTMALIGVCLIGLACCYVQLNKAGYTGVGMDNILFDMAKCLFVLSAIPFALHHSH